MLPPPVVCGYFTPPQDLVAQVHGHLVDGGLGGVVQLGVSGEENHADGIVALLSGGG